MTEEETVASYFRENYGDDLVDVEELIVVLRQLLGWKLNIIGKLLAAAGVQADSKVRPADFIAWVFGGSPVARRKIAIYGGAFDPITNGHLTMAAQIVHSGMTDEVWLVPSGPRPDKPNLKTSVIDRFCMCQLAVNQCFSRNFPVLVDDCECFVEEALATYDLLCALKEKNPGCDFTFVIGSDWLQEGSSMADWDSKNWNWKEGDPEDQKRIVTGHKMLNEFDFLVVKRPGYEVPSTPDDPTGLKKFGPRMSWLQMPKGVTFVEGNLSSTEIRKRSQHELRIKDSLASKSTFAIEGLVPRAILGFMRREGLYMPLTDAPRIRQRVAVYGGAFDPITNSHLTCSAEILRSGCADRVWLVPCGPRPDKPKLKTPPLDRYCMCKIAVNTTFSVDFPVKTSDIECFSTEAFATYDLLCSLREKYPDFDFCFIIGSDWLQPNSNMAEWTSKNWDWKPGDPEDQRTIVTGHKMLEEFDFLVLKRPGYEVPSSPDDPTGLKKFGPRLSWVDMPEGMTFIEGNLSSTEIRRRRSMSRMDLVQVGRRFLLDGLCEAGVISYIHRRGLYT